MAEREIRIGTVYRHFKGGTYKVIGIATHTETQEKLVVYHGVRGTENHLWVRPYDAFVSKVDRDKYPDVKQEYRFELMEGVYV